MFSDPNEVKRVNSGEHTGAVYACTFNQSGTLLATAGQDAGIVLWDTSRPFDVSSWSFDGSHLDWSNY